MFPKLSSAVSAGENAVFTVAVGGTFQTKLLAAAALTATRPLVPLMELVTVSVAVMVRLPAVFSVAENVPAPLVSVLSAGSTACASPLVKCTIPVYPVAVLLNGS